MGPTSKITAGMGLLALAACGPANAPAGASRLEAPSSELSPASTCSVSSVDSILRWNGRDVYVDPHALLPTPNGYLLAASRSYLWRDSAGIQVSTPDSVLGFLVEGAHRLRPIPRPPWVGPLGDLRVAAEGPDRWLWLFEEEARDGEDLDHEEARLLSATLEDGRWSPPDTVIREGELSLFFHGSSRLMVGPRGPVWLMRGASPEAAAVWTEGSGGWHGEAFDPMWPELLRLARSSRTGLWAAGFGRAEPTNRFRSVLLFEADGASSRRHLLFRTEGQEVFGWAGLATGPWGLALGWITRAPDGTNTAWAADRVQPGAIGRPVALQTRAEQIVTLVTGDGRAIWLVHHIPADGSGQELRVYAASPDGPPQPIASFDHPFLGYFGAFAASDADIVIVGPDVSRDPTRATVRSLQKRLSISCD